jgi:hypothetical protein
MVTKYARFINATTIFGGAVVAVAALLFLAGLVLVLFGFVSDSASEWIQALAWSLWAIGVTLVCLRPAIMRTLDEGDDDSSSCSPR